MFQGPIRWRTSRNVGRPTAAVMRRTWRFRPSRSSRSIQAVGISRRTRIGGSRGQRSAAPRWRARAAGWVWPSRSSTPSRSCSSAALVGLPSTWTQYALGELVARVGDGGLQSARRR